MKKMKKTRLPNLEDLRVVLLNTDFNPHGDLEQSDLGNFYLTDQGLAKLLESIEGWYRETTAV